MTFFQRARFLVLLASLSAICSSTLSWTQSQNPPASPEKYPSLPSEIPATFTPVTTTFDYQRRDVMIPMRDGVKLHAVIIVPKDAKNAPILLTRTPYNASSMVEHNASSHLARILEGYDNPTPAVRLWSRRSAGEASISHNKTSQVREGS